MTHTAKAIVARLEEDREFWRATATSGEEASTSLRLAAQSRVEMLSDLLAWLPKELDRVEADAIDEADRLDRILDLVA